MRRNCEYGRLVLDFITDFHHLELRYKHKHLHINDEINIIIDYINQDSKPNKFNTIIIIKRTVVVKKKL